VTPPHPSGTALVAHLSALGVAAELVAPGVPMPTVPAAAAAIGVTPDDIVKSVLFVAPEGTPVLAIACGTARIDRALLAAAAGLPRLSIADPATVLARTGYPAGGVSPVHHATPLTVVVDSRVTDRPYVFGGAGAEDLLLRISPVDILRLTGAAVAQITVPSA
jgi:prolyl-tRNA editing enzyme YbaK/EbsC (Cys-tRNA(Pro) deacylase)